MQFGRLLFFPPPQVAIDIGDRYITIGMWACGSAFLFLGRPRGSQAGASVRVGPAKSGGGGGGGGRFIRLGSGPILNWLPSWTLAAVASGGAVQIGGANGLMMMHGELVPLVRPVAGGRRPVAAIAVAVLVAAQTHLFGI